MAPILSRLSSGGGFGFSKITVASSAGAVGIASTVSRNLRFNSSDSAYLSRTPGSAGNRKTWTWSGWVKRSTLGSNQRFFGMFEGGVAQEYFRFETNDTLYIGVIADAKTFTTTQVFRDTSAWYHIVVVLDTQQGTDTNRLKLYVNGSQVTSFSTANYPVQDSSGEINNTRPHFISNGGGTEYFNGYLANIHFIDGYAYDASYFGQTNATTGVWDPIVYTGSYGSQGWFLNLADNSSTTSGSNAGIGKDTSGNGNYWNSSGLTVVNTGIYSNLASGTFDQGYYKPSNMWTSSGLSNTSNVQTANTTSSSGSYGTSVYFNLSSNPIPASSVDLWILKDNNMGGYGVNIEINGTNITPSVLTTGYSWVGVTGLSSLTSIRIPAGAYCGGIRINGTVFVEGQTSDSLIDTPTNGSQTDTGLGGEVVGNYATWNPLTTSGGTFTNGNLDVTVSGSGSSGWRAFGSTISVSSGKWYMETTLGSPFVGGVMTGIAKLNTSDNLFNPATFSNNFPGMTANSYALNYFSGDKRNNSTDAGYGSAIASGDVVMCALDMDSGKVYWGKNGTWFASGNPASGTNPAYSGLSGTFVFAGGLSAGDSIVSNYGARAFSYTAPSGFKALCTANLPEGSVTTSGTFNGNASADGPFIYLNGVPTAMTINGNAVTFGTQADKLSNGFKLRTSSASYNTSGSNTYSITTTGDKFKNARAQTNP